MYFSDIASKFHKLLSPRIEPIIISANSESLRYCETNKREWQAGGKGGIGKLADGTGKQKAVFGRRDAAFGRRGGKLEDMPPNALP